MSESVKYVGLDVHKDAIAVALAEGASARRCAAWRDCQHASGDDEAARQAWRAGRRSLHLLRSRAVRLRHPASGGHRWPWLRRGRAIADPQPPWRPNQKQIDETR